MTTHPIITTPLTRATLRKIQDLSEAEAAIDFAMDIISSHPDPAVRLASAKIEQAVKAWKLAAAERAKALISDTGSDHMTVELSPVEATVLGRQGATGAVVVNPAFDAMPRIEIVPSATPFVWSAVAPMPGRLDGSEYACEWAWQLNGNTVNPREKVEVEVGDRIDFGRTVIHLVLPT